MNFDKEGAFGETQSNGAMPKFVTYTVMHIFERLRLDTLLDTQRILHFPLKRERVSVGVIQVYTNTKPNM